ncbi:hypothetical protein EYF80_049741 [Liparis tanakae]|uniref:Uncharacterized protein n=1 Tax=Liparis tanakae TaxID=230148 RepID=A0A4Z2FIH4_9TELE|nr:hypothetical protein EYF80_049741 [Liparis tanakae]
MDSKGGLSPPVRRRGHHCYYSLTDTGQIPGSMCGTGRQQHGTQCTGPQFVGAVYSNVHRVMSGTEPGIVPGCLHISEAHPVSWLGGEQKCSTYQPEYPNRPHCPHTSTSKASLEIMRRSSSNILAP